MNIPHSFKHLFTVTIALLLGCLGTPIATAEQMKLFDDIEVHYSVVRTSMIPPEVASTYSITRGPNRMLLNVSIQKRTGEYTTASQAGTVTGTRHDLIKPYPLAFSEVREQEAIYYLADFPIINEEITRFNISVVLESGKKLDLEFQKTLYID